MSNFCLTMVNRGNLSGSLLDRIDLMFDVRAAPETDLIARDDGEALVAVRVRIAAARARQQTRQGKPNALLSPAEVDMHCLPDGAGEAPLKREMQQLGLTARAYHHILKVARAIADLADLSDRATLSVEHVAEAAYYRRGLAH